MSRVFVALETALQRRVVVKVLLPELAAGVSVERFRREILLAAQLQHPHIVPLLSAGESDGLPYFTMPFVDGESLRARLLRERELPVAEAARVLRDVASALAYAHARGVVHRDIKPDNVLLSHGTAVVTDFGVAKALTASTGYSGAPTGPGLTSMGVTLGTPHYMAPEQGAGDPAMDHRVDLYAFGATAYEILTGEPPFTGNSPQAILGAHIVALPRPINSVRPGLPPLLGHIVMQCLEKRPADRPQSADEIIRGLDSLATPTGGTVPIRVTNGPHAKRPGQGRAWLRRIMVPLALVGIVVALALVAWPRRDAPRRAQPAPAATPESVAAIPAPAPTPPAPAATLDTFRAETTVAPARRPPPPAARRSRAPRMPRCSEGCARRRRTRAPGPWLPAWPSRSWLGVTPASRGPSCWPAAGAPRRPPSSSRRRARSGRTPRRSLESARRPSRRRRPRSVRWRLRRRPRRLRPPRHSPLPPSRSTACSTNTARRSSPAAWTRSGGSTPGSRRPSRRSGRTSSVASATSMSI